MSTPWLTERHGYDPTFPPACTARTLHSEAPSGLRSLLPAAFRRLAINAYAIFCSLSSDRSRCFGTAFRSPSLTARRRTAFPGSMFPTYPFNSTLDSHQARSVVNSSPRPPLPTFTGRINIQNPLPEPSRLPLLNWRSESSSLSGCHAFQLKCPIRFQSERLAPTTRPISYRSPLAAE